MNHGLRPCLLTLALAVTSACGPSVGTSGSGSGSGSGGSTGASGGTSGGSTGSSGTTGGTTGGQTCPPITPEVITADFTVNPEPSEGVDTLSCVVLSVTNEQTSTTLELTCGGPPDAPQVTLTYGALVHTPPALIEGDGVTLSVAVDTPFWMNRWFALFRSGGAESELLAAGIRADRLDPPGMTFGEFLQGAADLATVDGLCPDEPGDCGKQRRLALDLTAAGETTRVVSPGDGVAGGLALLVEFATLNVPPIQCSDLPGEWFDLVIERQP